MNIEDEARQEADKRFPELILAPENDLRADDFIEGAKWAHEGAADRVLRGFLSFRYLPVDVREYFNGYLEAEDDEQADREPSDVDVLAALNARQRIVREQNQMPMETWQDAPSLDLYGTESVEGMRAALIAAQEVRNRA
ncbi:MAG: hypothetical protein ACTH4Y_08220 [Microbacterium gubbeenense]|uniref:hypothetical protein n=1 Tax=Microbacterium gubbeenense TaxID=159896 RepID=UPI003F9CECAC